MNKVPREWSRIARISQKVRRNNPRTIVPLGDDAFVYASFEQFTAWSQDLMIEHTHFNTTWSSPYDIGYKALARCLSDMAAMAATPEFVQISLAIPKNLTDSWLDKFYEGAIAAADLAQVEIVGGDLSDSQIIVCDVSICGSTSSPLTRSRGQAGDILLISGPLGLAETGLRALKASNKDAQNFSQSIHRNLRGQARLDLLEQLTKLGPFVHACIDTSDDLATSAWHIARTQGLGLRIDLDKVPSHLETKKFCTQHQLPLSQFQIYGGEDYELLIAVPPGAVEFFAGWHSIGELTNESKYTFTEEGQETALDLSKSFDRFADA